VVEIDCGPSGFAVKAYLLVGERPILVDTGIAGSTEHILGALARQGFVPRDLALIVLTHAHRDHTGSARELSIRCDAPIAIHRADAVHLRTGSDAPIVGRSVTGRVLAGVIGRSKTNGDSHHAALEPDFLLEGGEPLSAWGVDATVLHTPGHTDGSVSLLLDSGEAIVADLLSAAFARRGTPAPGMFAVDREAMDASIREVVERAPRLTYVSHAHAFPLAALLAAFG
jgi:glyoxylase-like metal-dependent hydrolase (beta-lactamase superfamily II)